MKAQLVLKYQQALHAQLIAKIFHFRITVATNFEFCFVALLVCMSDTHKQYAWQNSKFVKQRFHAVNVNRP